MTSFILQPWGVAQQLWDSHKPPWDAAEALRLPHCLVAWALWLLHSCASDWLRLRTWDTKEGHYYVQTTTQNKIIHNPGWVHFRTVGLVHLFWNAYYRYQYVWKPTGYLFGEPSSSPELLHPLVILLWASNQSMKYFIAYTTIRLFGEHNSSPALLHPFVAGIKPLNEKYIHSSLHTQKPPTSTIYRNHWSKGQQNCNLFCNGWSLHSMCLHE